MSVCVCVSACVGKMSYTNVSGGRLGTHLGRGVQAEFLHYQFTDGKPKELILKLWIPYRYRTSNFVKSENTKYKGVETNTFYVNDSIPETSGEVQAAQKDGQMPYYNIFNLAFVTTRPVVASFPNYINSSPKMLNQSDNGVRTSSTAGGVNLFRGTSSYYSDAKFLAEPVPITTSTWDAHYRTPAFWRWGLLLGPHWTVLLLTCSRRLRGTATPKIRTRAARCSPAALPVAPPPCAM